MAATEGTGGGMGTEGPSSMKPGTGPLKETIDAEFYDEDSDFANERWIHKKFLGHTLTAEERQQAMQQKEERKKKKQELRAIAAEMKDAQQQQRRLRLSGGDRSTILPNNPVNVGDLLEKHRAEGVVAGGSEGEAKASGVNRTVEEIMEERRKKKEEDKKKELQFLLLIQIGRAHV